MRTHLLFFAFILLMGMGCQGTPSPTTSAPSQPSADESVRDVDLAEPDSDEHLGCAEAEIMVNGSSICIPYGADGTITAYPELQPDAIERTAISYGDGYTGVLARPTEPGEYPGIVMIHEWWGLNDNIEMMAELLAQEGYVVLAVDLYNGEVAEDSDQAGKLAGAARANPEESLANMKAAIAYLQAQEDVKTDAIGSLGWCFGGNQSLNIATANADIAATVIYYGSVRTQPDELGVLQGPVLGIFGAEDTSIPVADVEAFEAALDDRAIDNQIVLYDGVGHAFANPSGARFAPAETADAWERTLDFLELNLR